MGLERERENKKERWVSVSEVREREGRERGSGQVSNLEEHIKVSPFIYPYTPCCVCCVGIHPPIRPNHFQFFKLCVCFKWNHASYRVHKLCQFSSASLLHHPK